MCPEGACGSRKFCMCLHKTHISFSISWITATYGHGQFCITEYESTSLQFTVPCYSSTPHVCTININFPLLKSKLEELTPGLLLHQLKCEFPEL